MPGGRTEIAMFEEARGIPRRPSTEEVVPHGT
jgi:hypothetical protein